MLELKIPPVLLALLMAALMWLITRITLFQPMMVPGSPILASLVSIFGGVVALAGVIAFRQAGTTVDPRTPDKAAVFVTSGIYRYTRNPMYLGLLLALTGWAIFLENSLVFLGLPAFVLFIHHYQIVPEERTIRSKFGHAYEQYIKSVRRWC